MLILTVSVLLSFSESAKSYSSTISDKPSPSYGLYWLVSIVSIYSSLFGMAINSKLSESRLLSSVSPTFLLILELAFRKSWVLDT